MFCRPVLSYIGFPRYNLLLTFEAGRAIGMYLSPVWYVTDSWPMIIAPLTGSGTTIKEYI